MKLLKAVTIAFFVNALLAPALFAGTLLSSSAAFAQDPPDVCYVIIFTCSRKDPDNCTVSEPLIDSDCDGEPD